MDIDSVCASIDSLEERCRYCQETNDLACCVFGNTYIVLCGQCLSAKNYRKEKALTCYVCHEKIDDFKFICPMGIRYGHSAKQLATSKVPLLMINSPECVRYFNTKQKRILRHQRIKYSKTCLHCDTISKNMKKCSRCKCVYYCSSECQLADWKKHKKICKHFDLT